MTLPDVLAKANEWRVARPTSSPLRPDVEGLVEPGVDALPVRMTVVQDGVTTGWDDGALGFEEDAVWFNGRSTSFRLAAGDILPGEPKRSRLEAVTDGEALRQGFPLRHPTRAVWVRVQILKTDGRKDWEDEARLIREVKHLRARSEHGGESQYPPLVPRPGTIERQPSIRRRIVFGGVGFAAMMLGPALSKATSWYVGSPLTILGIVLFFSNVVFSNPHQERLRQIAREEAPE